MTKPDRARYGRWIFAFIASLIVLQMGRTQYGFSQSAHDAPPCGLSAVNAYFAALQSDQVEVTPTYRFNTAQAFITACPDRWEVRDAHLVAARGALDSGRALLAARHYNFARKRGGKLSPENLMDEAVVLDAAQNFTGSKAARNRAVYDWIAKLDAEGLADLSVKRVREGSIYTAEFAGEDAKIKAVWLAVPKGAGLPAAVILRRDPERSAWRSIRHPGAPLDLRVLERQTCRARDLLIESETAIKPESVQTQAMQNLRAYLKAPEHVEKTQPGRPIASCLWLSDMLHIPGKE